MFRHKDEKLDFSDDAIMTSAIQKYINRGLFELNNLYKSKDDFYQFLIDEFGEFKTQTMQTPENSAICLDSEMLLEYFKKQQIKAEILNQHESIRHDVFKIHILNDNDYKKTKQPNRSFKAKFWTLWRRNAYLKTRRSDVF